MPKATNYKSEHYRQALNYAESVVAGEIAACKWVRLACKRHIDDLERSLSDEFAYEFDERKADTVCRFIGFLPNIKGRQWAGEPLALQPWQKFILCSVFGWVDKKTRLRRFRTAYNEMPRKQGKSTLSSGISLYMLTEDGEPGAEVYSAATTRDQARIVFDDGQAMARKCPDLCEFYGVAVNAHNINVVATASKFEALSSEGNTLDGLNPHCAVIDELHAHRTRAVFDVINSATGSRSQPLIWVITTAGFNRSGVCYEQRNYATKILEGVHQDDNYFAIIYTIDDGDDWTSEDSWKKANPNYAVSVEPKDIALMCRQAMQSAQSQNNFLTKRLNVWVNADTAWMSMSVWDACADKSLRLEDFEGQPCYVAVDLATKKDISAKVRMFRRDQDYYLFGTYYLPEEAIEPGVNTNAAHYAGWEIEGRLKVTDGNVTDFEVVWDDILDDFTKFEVRCVVFDPFQALLIQNSLQKRGIPASKMVDCQPSVSNFSTPMKEFEALALAGRIHHDGDPVLAWMISNVVCHTDAKDNIYPRKERPENKIDAVIAVVMDMKSWLADGIKRSVYETRGIISIGPA